LSRVKKKVYILNLLTQPSQSNGTKGEMKNNLSMSHLFR
jgi:hypothetical protein